MSQISREQLNELEQLFSQSAKGIHLLFDKKDLVDALQVEETDADLSLEHLNKVQGVLENLIQQKTIFQKYLYLKKLSPESYKLLVRTYFNIVENAMIETLEFKH